MSKKIILSASILGLLAVILSALSSHALKPSLQYSGMIDSFNTATSILLTHSIMAIVSAILGRVFYIKQFFWGGWGFIFGSMIFAIPIFFKSFNPDTFIGPITPFGGAILMLSWILLIWGSIKIKSFPDTRSKNS